MNILKAENLTYHYKTRTQTVKAVDGVSLELEKGSLYALVGKSGSGKSTLLSLLAGLESPMSGSIAVNGKALMKEDLTLYRRNVASFIFQSFNLFPLMTVMENCMYPLLLQNRSRKEAASTAGLMLEKAGLDGLLFDRLPAQLSGGEQQRAAIARALAAGTDIVFADEPTGNLDSKNSEQILSLLRAVSHEEGRCVLVGTHDLNIANAADTVFRMDSGKLNKEVNA